LLAQHLVQNNITGKAMVAAGRSIRKIKKNRQQPNSFRFLFVFYASAVFVLASVIYQPSSVDAVQPIRLLTLSLFSLVAGLVLFFTKKIKKTSLQLWHNPLIWCWLGLLGLTAASVAVAFNPTESFFDIAKTSVFVALTLLGTAILHNTENWPQRLLKFILLAALISLLVGFYQYYKFVLGSNLETLPDGRPLIYEVKGLMGHKNQHAINLMLMLPMIIYGMLFQQGAWRNAARAIFAGAMFMIILVQTRSVWLALFIASLVAGVFLAFNFRYLGIAVKIRNRVLVAAMVAVLAGIAAIVFIPSGNRLINTHRIKSMVELDAGDNPFRLRIWLVTGKMIADHPLTGVGAGNWKLRIPEYFPEQLERKRQLNWLRPHNDAIWVLAEKGITGLMFYMACFFITLLLFVRSFLKTTERRTKILALLLGSGFVAYHITSMFSFPLERLNQQMYLSFFTAAGIVLSFPHQKNVSAKSVSKILAVALVVLTIFPVVYSISTMRSYRWIAKAKATIHNLTLVRSQLLQVPDRPARERQLSNQLLFEISKAETWSRKLDNEATPLHWYKGLAYAGLQDFEMARQAYLEAHRQHPHKVIILHNLAIAYNRLGDFENAIHYFWLALDKLPQYRETLVALAYTYEQMGDYNQSLQVLEKIRPEEVDQSIVLKKRELLNLFTETERN
jgi:O-antigen ligase